MKKSEVLNFKKAFMYPFNRAKGMLNVLWALFPIFGWFALGGYGVRIVQDFSKGKFKQLPEMKFGSDMKLGFFMFLKSIPFMLVYIVVSSVLDMIPVLGKFGLVFLELFIVPIMGINFVNKMSVSSYFEFEILEKVFANLGDYLFAVLKSIGLAIVFIFMIVILVGLPGLIFTGNIFLADFYRRRMK
jgi:hypothetical protein